MRIPRIFVDSPLVPGETVSLPSNRSHYLINVLRLKVDQALIIFNGQGGEYLSTLASATKKEAVINVNKFNDINNESPLYTELAIGVSKGERMDWVMQKATELGVSSIRPLLTERSEVKLNTERWQKKLAHWREIIISACEQCGQNKIPTITEPAHYQHYSQTCKLDTKLILHPTAGDPNIEALGKPTQVALLIGPEGGFSDEEVALAQQANFELWSLGPRVLRTETAPVAALSILQSHFGDI